MMGGAANKAEKPFGSWPSPITAEFITTSGVRLGAPVLDDDGKLFWAEGRPQEKGRNVVVQHVGAGTEDASERGGMDVTPADVNVRTRVHEYGGGAWALVPKAMGGGVVYCDFMSQRLFHKKDGAEPVCLTPECTCPDGRYRFADGCFDERLGYVCVREDHENSSPATVKNEIVAVALDGSGTVTLLATGNDFVAHPRVSPDGSKLAYVCWDHPNMPWDVTELRVASISAGNPESSSHSLVAGGEVADSSVLQPAWHPSGSSLYFIDDSSGYYNMRRVKTEALNVAAPPSAAPRAARETDFGGSAPGWSLGQQGYTFLMDGRVAATVTDRKSGESLLLVFADDDATPEVAEFGKADGLPHMFGGIQHREDGTLFMSGGSPSEPSGIYSWGLAAAEEARAAGSAAPEAVKICSSSSKTIPAEYVSTPTPVDFPCPLGTAYGYYYAPFNGDCESSEAAPPLLVKAHGGPTACTGAGFNPGIQYWTSRGFAVLDVDYGGSTGYGKEYRRRLRGAWGIVDIDDVCAGAQHLVKQGLADPKRLAIDGGSAGGFTTLGALAFKDVFTAGCSLYGVADLGALAEDTHKFESRYLDGLVGRWPEDKKIYEERAPINAVDRLSCPILLLQGDEDKIVPPNQAELMHAALLKKKIPTALKIYQGEQHGFRQAKNIEDALESELFFFSRVFGFEPADKIEPFKIDNLD